MEGFGFSGGTPNATPLVTYGPDRNRDDVVLVVASLLLAAGPPGVPRAPESHRASGSGIRLFRDAADAYPADGEEYRS
jgi:hypothetical protein